MNASVRGQCVDEATLPCLVWAFSTRYYEPDQVEHECVNAFEPSTLLNIFGCQVDVLKSKFARSALEDTPINKYLMFSIVFFAHRLGHPFGAEPAVHSVPITTVCWRWRALRTGICIVLK